jgi:hypothetical protein
MNCVRTIPTTMRARERPSRLATSQNVARASALQSVAYELFEKGTLGSGTNQVRMYQNDTRIAYL